MPFMIARETDDKVERRAQLVTHVCPEPRLFQAIHFARTFGGFRKLLIESRGLQGVVCRRQ